MFKVSGYETYRNGLHDYFQKYSWKNTVLDDFVSCQAQAYSKSGDKSMGPDFDFEDWCQKWLNSSGINILEPVVEYNEDGSLKSFEVKQTCDVTGKNILRTHKLDIAFYDQDYKEHIISDVIIGDKQELTRVNVESVKGAVNAIVINHGAHTYAKIRYDQKTLNNLENDLYKIDDFLTRCQIWNQMWFQMFDHKMTSI